MIVREALCQRETWMLIQYHTAVLQGSCDSLKGSIPNAYADQQGSVGLYFPLESKDLPYDLRERA